MEFLWIVVGVVILGGIIGAMFASGQVQDVQRKFASLGEVPGKTRNEIEAVVGPPVAVSALPDGKKLLQWQIINQAGGYHIGLVFDQNDVCEGISHESAV